MDGELADVVRGGSSSEVSVAAMPEFQFPAPYLSSSGDADFGDPFSNFGDPLLHELDMGCLGLVFKEPSTINTNTNATSMGASFKTDMVKSCGGDSKVLNLQISSSPRNPGGGEAKRRKNQAKKVICIPAPAPANSRPSSGEVVPSDLWAWRKYGQKPIKGSPYPRGYYRCSSSKSCSARKQVERSRNDPNMLVITYTSEHNHPWPTQRNALAGSTRTHPLKNPNPNPKPPSSSSSSSSLLNPKITVHDENHKDLESVDEVDEDLPRQRSTSSCESTRHNDMFSNHGKIKVGPVNAMRGNDDNIKAIDPFTLLDWTASNCLHHRSSA